MLPSLSLDAGLDLDARRVGGAGRLLLALAAAAPDDDESPRPDAEEDGEDGRVSLGDVMRRSQPRLTVTCTSLQ